MRSAALRDALAARLIGAACGSQSISAAPNPLGRLEGCSGVAIAVAD